jgi:diguanylate cyclase (GGDEF)-like protein
VGSALELAAIADLSLAVSILALTVARQLGSARPAYTRSWIFFGFAAAALLARSTLELAGGPARDLAQIAQVATTGLLGVGFMFLYGADREGIERIQDQAERDHLTGLHNVRAFAAASRERLTRISANGGRAAVAILDLDEFKAINDTHGHQMGDRILQLVGGAIRANIRPHDLAARYGGDEFVLLLDRCEAEEAKQVCTRILRSVVMLSHAAGRQVSLSCGIAIAPDSGTELRDLIARADEQLLAVKRAGRGAVRTATA